jgi:hypothetical protein
VMKEAECADLSNIDGRRSIDAGQNTLGHVLAPGKSHLRRYKCVSQRKCGWLATDDQRPTTDDLSQSSLTKNTLPSAVLVSRATSSARLRSSCNTLTRTHQSPTGLPKLSTFAVL